MKPNAANYRIYRVAAIKSVYWGKKHTRCRQTRIDGRRKALFRLDDIEDRAVNVDPLPMILGKPPALLQLGDDRQVPGDPSSRGFFLVIIDLTVGL
jgi:hypothetical protein